MARRSTTKFATICLALSAEESIEVPIYYRKEGDGQLGYFVTKPEQLHTSKGRNVFIREYKDQDPRSLRDRIRESLERELEPKVTFERTITRNDSFELPNLEYVISCGGRTSDLKQSNSIFSAEYLGKHYSFVRAGTYPVAEGVEIKEPDTVLVSKTAPDFIELKREIEGLHARFYADVCKLWNAVELARTDATARFASGKTQTPEVQQPQEQNQSSFDAILNTYKTS